MEARRHQGQRISTNLITGLTALVRICHALFFSAFGWQGYARHAFEKKLERRRPSMRSCRETVWTRLATGAHWIESNRSSYWILVTLIIPTHSNSDPPRNHMERRAALLVLVLEPQKRFYP